MKHVTPPPSLFSFSFFLTGGGLWGLLDQFPAGCLAKPQDLSPACPDRAGVPRVGVLSIPAGERVSVGVPPSLQPSLAAVVCRGRIRVIRHLEIGVRVVPVCPMQGLEGHWLWGRRLDSCPAADAENQDHILVWEAGPQA